MPYPIAARDNGRVERTEAGSVCRSADGIARVVRPQFAALAVAADRRPLPNLDRRSHASADPCGGSDPRLSPLCPPLPDAAILGARIGRGCAVAVVWPRLLLTCTSAEKSRTFAR